MGLGWERSKGTNQSVEEKQAYIQVSGRVVLELFESPAVIRRISCIRMDHCACVCPPSAPSLPAPPALDPGRLTCVNYTQGTPPCPPGFWTLTLDHGEFWRKTGEREDSEAGMPSTSLYPPGFPGQQLSPCGWYHPSRSPYTCLHLVQQSFYPDSAPIT